MSLLGGDKNWLGRSLDLTTFDFFLWGKLGAQVFKHRLRALEELKAVMLEEVFARSIQYRTGVFVLASVYRSRADNWAI